ncbi:MAG: pimeloyl-ACP methyl ester carboxylesterase [Paracoccaceae bacterium]|jgi:pimeloyl-ACP methyl ester carboxylesterase
MTHRAPYPALRHTRRTLLGGGAAALLSACAPGSYAQRAEARWPPEGAFTEVEGLRVHHVQDGPVGGPSVILIHGATGNLRDMTFDLAPRLAAMGMRVTAFDRPGLGYTDRPADDPWRPATQARILRAAARRIGAADGAVVLGHSWGAAVAMAWGLEARDEARGMVCLSGATMPWGEADSPWDVITASAPVTALKGALARAMIGLDGGASVAERIFAPQSAPAGYIAYVGGPLTLRPASFSANSEDIDRLHEALLVQAPLYPGLTLPVEILHGAADQITWPSVHATGMAAALPRGRARILDGVGHMLHHADPKAAVAAVARVLAA